MTGVFWTYKRFWFNVSARRFLALVTILSETFFADRHCSSCSIRESTREKVVFWFFSCCSNAFLISSNCSLARSLERSAFKYLSVVSIALRPSLYSLSLSPSGFMWAVPQPLKAAETAKANIPVKRYLFLWNPHFLYESNKKSVNFCLNHTIAQIL